MSTNDRDELASDIAMSLSYNDSTPNSTLDTSDLKLARIGGWFDLRGVADILIEHGWRKVGVDTETRVEWGVRRPPKFGCTVAWMTNRGEAESLAAAWDNGSVVVSRTVFVGPWSEVDQ